MLPVWLDLNSKFVQIALNRITPYSLNWLQLTELHHISRIKNPQIQPSTKLQSIIFESVLCIMSGVFTDRTPPPPIPAVRRQQQKQSGWNQCIVHTDTSSSINPPIIILGSSPSRDQDSLISPIAHGKYHNASRLGLGSWVVRLERVIHRLIYLVGLVFSSYITIPLKISTGLCFLTSQVTKSVRLMKDNSV